MDHDTHDHGSTTTRGMAVSATLHCLTGCAIGEIAGLMIGTAIGLSTGWTVALAVSLVVDRVKQVISGVTREHIA